MENKKITIIENNKNHFKLLKSFLYEYSTNDIDINLIKHINTFCSIDGTSKSNNILNARKYLVNFFETNKDSLCFVIDYQMNEDSGKEHVNADKIILLLQELKITNFFILSGKLSSLKRNEFTSKSISFLEKIENWSEKQYPTVMERMKNDLCQFISEKFKGLKIKIGILTVLPVENEAIKKVFEVNETNESTTLVKDHIIYEKEVTIKGQIVLLYLGCYGKAGNINSSTFTTQFINNIKPDMMILCGIAVAINDGKIRIGDVFYSRSISSTEKTVVKDSSSSKVPRINNLSTPVLSMYSNHHFEYEKFFSIIKDKFDNTFIIDHENADNIVLDMKPKVDDCSINSEDSLFRISIDTVKDLNPESKLSEMEAMGFVSACEAVYNRNIPWLVVRSVSDFGLYKENNYQDMASSFAACYVKYFVEYVINPKLLQ